MASAHLLTSDALQRHMEETIEVTVSTTVTSSFKATGGSHEADYFEKKYKDKEEIKNNIYANAEKFWCPTKKVNMW